MTIARYCGGLILALSFAGMGAAAGCTRAADDSRDISEEAVGVGAQALSGGEIEPVDWYSDDWGGYCDDGGGCCDDWGGCCDDWGGCCDDGCGCCDEWEAVVFLDDDAKFAFIEVDHDCEIDDIEINGYEVDCHPGNGPKCNEDGFRHPDCIVNLNKYEDLFWDGYYDDLVLTVRVEGCDKDPDNIEIALWENGNSCDEVHCDDMLLICCDD